MKAAVLSAVILILGASVCRNATPVQAAPPEVTVAGASNLTEVFGLMGPVFESATGIHPVFSFGATAQLAQQIESGAPWDVFAAADAEHVDQLDAKGLLVPGSRAVYATGILAMWIPPTAKATTGCPKKSVRSVQLVGVGSTTSSLARHCWRSVSRGRRWASLRQRDTGAL